MSIAPRITGAWLAAATVLAACLGGLGAAVTAGGDPATPVLVVARTVLQGQVIESADLAIAEIVAPGVRFVPAADKPQVVGQRAAYTLQPGSLLDKGGYGTPRPPDGTEQLSLLLGASQIPDVALPGGALVILIGLPAPEAEDEPALLVTAWVVFPPVATADGGVLLDVAVNTRDVTDLAPYLLDRRVTVIVA